MQTFTGLEYIKIAIANARGMDKETWNKRITWAADFLAKGPVEQSFEIDCADEPLLMQKAINAHRDAIAGVATGFIMGLDATASGLQVMACAIGCEKTATNVNLIETTCGTRKDIYTKVAFTLNAITAAIGLVTNYARGEIKKPVMTTFYGSMQQPAELFGEGTPELQAFYETLEKELPGACEVMADIQSCWQPSATSHDWTLPDKHRAQVKVMNMVDKKIEVDELNHATFTHRIAINAANKKGLSLAANVIHSLDGWVVREMYRRASLQGFAILTIHDSFWCSPNHMNKLRQNYNDILAEICDNDYLGDILREITGTTAPYIKYSTTMGNLVRTANYSLS